MVWLLRADHLLLRLLAPSCCFLIMLSDSDSDAPDDVQITINEHYAKAYAYRKEREELQKLKDTYGSDASEGDLTGSEDSEELESEDEDGEELTPAVDAALLRTLARIKKKDPAIYGTGNIFEGMCFVGICRWLFQMYQLFVEKGVQYLSKYWPKLYAKIYS